MGYIIGIVKLSVVLTILGACGQPKNEPTENKTKDILAVLKNTHDTVYHYNGYSEIIMQIKTDHKTIQKKVFELQSDTSFYDNGKRSYVGVGTIFNRQDYEYYRNGRLKRVSEHGTPFGCYTQVGKELNYDSLGNLFSKLIFFNYLPDSASGCHSTRTIITTTEYYLNKKVKLQKQEETSYEAGIDCPCGTWEYFDEEGKLTKKEKHENCKDGLLDCAN